MRNGMISYVRDNYGISGDIIVEAYSKIIDRGMHTLKSHEAEIEESYILAQITVIHKYSMKEGESIGNFLCHAYEGMRSVKHNSLESLAFGWIRYSEEKKIDIATQIVGKRFISLFMLLMERYIEVVNIRYEIENL